MARTTWRRAKSVPGLNRARAKLNRAIGKFVAWNGGLVVRHKELEEADPEPLRTDGIHLKL